MGLILDLGVVVLAVAVIGSLALLTWTLAVSAVRALAGGRAKVVAARERVVGAEIRLPLMAERVLTTVARLNDRLSHR